MSNETTIPALLQRLSKAQPDVCRSTVPFYGYAIGEYSFWYMPEEGGLMAQTNGGHGQVLVTGRPALAWLRDAVEAAIEAAGLYWHIKHYPSGSYDLVLEERSYHWLEGEPDGPAEALLAAFVEWAEAVRE